MNGNEKTKNYESNSREYLEQTRESHLISPASGLYEPKPQDSEPKIQNDRPEENHDRILNVRLERDWQDRFQILATLSGGGIALATILVATASIVISFFTLLLLARTVQYAKLQWQEMRETVAQSIRSADAATSAADTAKDALVSVQRAFVFPIPQSDPIPQGANPIWGFAVSTKWENSGSTPTKNMTIHQSSEQMINLPKGFAFPDKWEGAGPHRATPAYISPKGFVNSANVILIPLSQATTMAKSGLAYYVWGWARYDDVFAKTEGHITKYCYRVFAVTNPIGISGGVNISFEDCPVNNCYDDECKKK